MAALRIYCLNYARGKTIVEKMFDGYDNRFDERREIVLWAEKGLRALAVLLMFLARVQELKGANMQVGRVPSR